VSGISFIISTRWASEVLELQLDSLEYSKNFDNEIIVICDNPSWQVLKLLQDRGFIHGKNYFIVNHGHLDQNLDWGVDKANRDYICLSPDDIVFCKDFDRIVLAEMDESKNRIVTPAYYVGNTSGLMFRDFGFPKWKYLAGKPGEGFNFNKFYDEPKPSFRYAISCCGSCPVQVMHKDVYKKINGLTFCSPHSQGHEIEMLARALRLYQIERVISWKATMFHFGTIANTDGQNSAMHISRGHFKCNICGHLDPSEGDKEHFGTERGRIVLRTGLYLCDRCKKDGWKINAKVGKLLREDKT
jgi:hypothetical protein